jgi:iron complex outermembrane receptor protein
MKSRLLYYGLISAAVAGVTLAGTGTAQAQSGPDTAAEEQESGKQDIIIVTGTRTEGRSIADSAVPVDVLTAEAIEDISFTDTNDIIKTLVPSYTIARQPISDGATFIRPAALRGLSSDKTLVLVNSKRRHRAALVSIGGSGTQGPDVATIPASAIKAIEVLRDGAAAQYGSDAIAGVMNFILKDAPSGGEIQFQAGSYYEEDGEDLLIAANLGLALGEDGFLNISVEGTAAQPTNRGSEWRIYRGQVNGVNWAQGGFDVEEFKAANPQYQYLFGSGADFDSSNVQIWGQPESEAFRMFVNSGYNIGGVELYGFANYSNSQSDGDFNYRAPVAAINTAQIRTQNGATFQYLSNYPAGRTPRFGGNVVDYSFTGGVKGEFADNFSYDFSGRYGKDTIYYTLWNTVNPSLGNVSPTSFAPGDLISDELAFNADFVYSMPVSFFANPLDIGFGAEYRDEGYEIVPGEESSWIAGPYALQDPWDFCTPALTPTAAGLAVIANGSTLNCANNLTSNADGFAGQDPVYTQLAVGSDGFPGNNPDYSGSLNRDSYAAYVDFASDVTDDLFLNLALRLEDYSDFGDTFDYKLSGRYSLTPDINIRGSVGTGFRAPTPGQLSTINVSTRFPAGEPVAVGLFPATNPVSQFLGAEELKPETSTNYSLGATGSFGPLDVTLDFYQIDLEDQFYATATITVDAAIRAALLSAGVPGADTIGGVNFFQNAFDSKTSGVDLVVTYDADWGELGTTTFTTSLNYNKFSIEQVNIANLFFEEDVFDFENAAPEIRGVFSAVHSFGDFTFMARANYTGDYTVSNCLTGNASDGFTCNPNPASAYPQGLAKQEIPAEVLFDLELGWDVTDDLSLAFGARNVLDAYPAIGNPYLQETTNGRIYRSDSIVDWQGGFYYVRAKQTF